MTIERKILLGIFLLIIINFTFQPALAQINETVIETVNDTIIANDIFQHKNEIIILNATFSDSSQKNDFGELFIESQNNFDRSLSIFNIVATSMAVLVALITLIIMIATVGGIFEYKKWVAIRNDAQHNLNIIKKIRKNAEDDVESIRKKIPEHIQLLSTDLPSKEVMKNLETLSSKLGLIELLGVVLKPEDIFDRSLDLYYKNDYDSALSLIDEGIKLNPNDHDLWRIKSTTLNKLERYQEALESIEKSIKLDPHPDIALIDEGIILQTIGQYDEAIIAYDKSLVIKPKYPTTLFNKACCYSLMGDKEKMLEYLKKAIAGDQNYKEMAKTDVDFKEFLNDDDFKNLIE